MCGAHNRNSENVLYTILEKNCACAQSEMCCAHIKMCCAHLLEIVQLLVTFALNIVKEVFYIVYIEFDAAVIISIKSSLLRLAPPTKAPFTFDIENISFALEPFTDPPYKIFTLWASAP